MSTSEDETVPVRVKDLKRLKRAVEVQGWVQMCEAAKPLTDLIPKPRLVTVDLDELKAASKATWPGHALHDIIERLEKEA